MFESLTNKVIHMSLDKNNNLIMDHRNIYFYQFS